MEKWKSGGSILHGITGFLSHLTGLLFFRGQFFADFIVVVYMIDAVFEPFSGILGWYGTVMCGSILISSFDVIMVDTDRTLIPNMTLEKKGCATVSEHHRRAWDQGLLDAIMSSG